MPKSTQEVCSKCGREVFIPSSLKTREQVGNCWQEHYNNVCKEPRTPENEKRFTFRERNSEVDLELREREIRIRLERSREELAKKKKNKNYLFCFTPPNFSPNNLF